MVIGNIDYLFKFWLQKEREDGNYWDKSVEERIFVFLLYFVDYAVTVAPIFPALSSIQHRPLTQAVPTPLFMSMVHCMDSLTAPFPILYFISTWLFYNYLFVLPNPLTSSPILPYPLPSGNHQNHLCIHDSVSLVVFLFFFFRFSC